MLTKKHNKKWLSNDKKSINKIKSHWTYLQVSLTSRKKGRMSFNHIIKEKIEFFKKPQVHWTGADKVYK